MQGDYSKTEYKEHSDGKITTDCSGLLLYLLCRAGYSEIKQELSQNAFLRGVKDIKRYYSRDFFYLLQKNNSQILTTIEPNIKNIQFGDIIIGIPYQKGYGHCMVYAETKIPNIMDEFNKIKVIQASNFAIPKVGLSNTYLLTDKNGNLKQYSVSKPVNKFGINFDDKFMVGRIIEQQK